MLIFRFPDKYDALWAKFEIPQEQQKLLTLELGDKFTVTGWGKVTNNVQSNFKRYKLFKASSRQLRKARIPGVTKTDCENEDLYKGYIDTNSQLCAGGEDGKFCFYYNYFQHTPRKLVNFVNRQGHVFL